MNAMRLWLFMCVLSMFDSMPALPFDVALKAPSKSSVRDVLQDFIKNNSLIQEYILNRNAVQNIMRDNNLKVPTLTRKYCKRFCIFGLELLVYTSWSTDHQQLLRQQQEGTETELERDLGTDTGGLNFNFQFDGASLLRTSTPYRVECRLALRRSIANRVKKKTKRDEKKRGLFTR